uniref:Dystrophin n=1 Tax=Branchiostoma floridae TaxID=7739 RepID=C3YXT5_BRAFL|eukprot:XP_002598882.1 hypothetical protein BRAFLDRAFT_90092 [Branchiostoma floridae]
MTESGGGWLASTVGRAAFITGDLASIGYELQMHVRNMLLVSVLGTELLEKGKVTAPLTSFFDEVNPPHFQSCSRPIVAAKPLEDHPVLKVLQKVVRMQPRRGQRDKSTSLQSPSWLFPIRELWDSRTANVVFWAIKEQLDTLEPQVRSAHERKGAAISQVAPSERKNIENAMSNLKVEWDKVNKDYVDRYSRFKKSLAHWQQFHCDMRDLTSWLNEAERTVQDTKAPGGDLDLEKARAAQKKLQDGIEKHRKQVEGLNANGQEIVEQCTSIDATLLREKLDGLNRRWRVLCAEVNDRKERHYKRLNEQMNTKETGPYQP